MSEPKYDWRGKKALSHRAELIAFLLRLLEGSYEQEKRLHLLGIKGALENYHKSSKDILKLIDELRTLMIKKHPDSLNNLPD